MKKLPDFVLRLKRSVPLWIDRLSHPDGPGRYRFAVEAYEPYELLSSTMMHEVICTVGRGRQGPLSDDERAAWIDYILDMQRAEDELVIDEGLERHMKDRDTLTDTQVFDIRKGISRNALSTVRKLGGKPRYPMANPDTFRTPDELTAWLDGLHWHNPWGAGSWAGMALVYQDFNRLLGDPNAEDIIRAGVDWLAERQDPETGAWSDGSDVPVYDLINGIFKVWIQVLPMADLPVQYPDRVVDLCLRGLAEDPMLNSRIDACSIFDVAYVLDITVRFTDHRRDEVADAAAAHLPLIEPMVRPDGALSYGPDGSRARGSSVLAPEIDQSEVPGTALNTHAIALLCNLCGLGDALGWTPRTQRIDWAGRNASAYMS